MAIFLLDIPSMVIFLLHSKFGKYDSVLEPIHELMFNNTITVKQYFQNIPILFQTMPFDTEAVLTEHNT